MKLMIPPAIVRAFVVLNLACTFGAQVDSLAGDRILQATDPCWTVRCSSDFPICIVLQGTAQCIKDPCLDLICNAASTCEVDKKGEAYCLPLPGNPGNPDPGITCAAVTCPIDAPICTILPNGSAKCLPDSGTQLPSWWDYIKENFDEGGLSSCMRFNNVAPSTGTKCLAKKVDKTCYFGNQLCEGFGLFPDTKCKCIDRKWSCLANVACPAN